MNHDHGEVILWERSLSMLPDAVYLDIVRNFLGKIPTPFHKPQLTKRLTNLFLNPEFRNRTVLALSEQDKQLLTATVILGNPTQDEICALFTDSVPYSKLLNNLINLEERLLLVPHPDSIESRMEIIINPLLKELLVETALSYGAIFPTTAANTPHAARYRLVEANAGTIRALTSLHIHSAMGPQDKSERIIRTKIAAAVFDFDSPELIDLLVYYNRLLFQEGVVDSRGNISRTGLARAEELIHMNAEQLQIRLFITTWFTQFPQHGKMMNSVASLQRFFLMIKRLLESLPIHTDEDMSVICKIAACKHGLSMQVGIDTVPLLKTIGLLGTYAQDEMEKPASNHHLSPTIDSDLSISFSGDIEPVEDKDLLHVIAVARKVNVVRTYEINKATVMRAFDLGFSVEEIIFYLKGLTHADFAQLETLMIHWRDEYSSITIFDGIVVKADQRQSRIIDALPTLQPHIIAKIAPGLFLFSRKSESVWREILISTGIGYLPSSISEEPQTRAHEIIETHVEIPDESTHMAELPVQTTVQTESLEPTFESLRKAIMAKVSSVSEREELLARLERKLILVPEQISAVQGPSQTMQASGFDFQGKMNLCKAAVQSKSDLLELHVMDDDGNTQMVLAEAKEFIPSAKDPSIRIMVLPEGDERVIAMNSLFKVRKLRRSVFFQM